MIRHPITRKPFTPTQEALFELARAGATVRLTIPATTIVVVGGRNFRKATFNSIASLFGRGEILRPKPGTREVVFRLSPEYGEAS